MKLYRLIARFAGQRITLDVNASNDEEAKNNFIKELTKDSGKWRSEREITYSPSKVFITYEEINDDRNVAVSITEKDQLGVQVEPVVSG
jgi:hypothetical protein